MADGVGIAPTQPGGSLGFQDRGIAALPTIRNGQGDRNCTWWPCASTLLPRWWPRANARLLLTLHPEKMAARVGLAPTPCGLTNRRATLTPPGNGAAGRIPTCIVPFRKRMPRMFSHGSSLKLVSAAGLAPAIPRFQAGHVAATPRAVCPGDWEGAGGLVLLAA